MGCMKIHQEACVVIIRNAFLQKIRGTQVHGVFFEVTNAHRSMPSPRIFHNKEYTILSFPMYQATHTLLLQAFKIGYCSTMPYCYHKQVHPRRVNSKNRSCNGICELPFQFHVTLHFFPTFLVVFQCHIKSVYPTILDVVRHKMYEEETTD